LFGCSRSAACFMASQGILVSQSCKRQLIGELTEPWGT
jgi:hypothetical protein